MSCKGLLTELDDVSLGGATSEDALSVQAIATLRGIDREDAEAELREAGVMPTKRSVAWADPTELLDAEVDLAALDAALDEPDPDTETPDVTTRENDEPPADH